MAIQFRCLNCGIKILADDEEAGDACECERCGVPFTVPQPIGGKLTNKRLNPAAQGVPAPEPPKPIHGQPQEPTQSAAEVPDQDGHFNLQNVPQYGFEIRVQIENEVYGRTERLWVEDSANFIRDRLLEHLELFPQYFERGFLTLNVRRWSIQPDSYDINIRLVGLLNGQEFSEYFYASPPSNERPALLHGFGLIVLIVRQVGSLLKSLVRIIFWSLLGFSLLRIAHRRLRKKAAKEFRNRLDVSAGKPLSLWTRVSAVFTKEL